MIQTVITLLLGLVGLFAAVVVAITKYLELQIAREKWKRETQGTPVAQEISSKPARPRAVKRHLVDIAAKLCGLLLYGLIVVLLILYAWVEPAHIVTTRDLAFFTMVIIFTVVFMVENKD